MLATTDIKERNFLGKGQEVDAKLAVSQREQSINLGYTEPYFLGRDMSAGVDVFSEKTDFQEESDYDLTNVGADVRLGFPLSEFARNTAKLGFKDTGVDNVGASASQFIVREEGDKPTVFLNDTISYDNRDSYLNPTRGYRIALTGEYAGFGFENSYVRGLASGSWNKELFDGVVLTLAARGGAVNAIGDTLPLFEEFQSGGGDLRGFHYAGIGPRDRFTDDALGGKYMVGEQCRGKLSADRGIERTRRERVSVCGWW